MEQIPRKQINTASHQTSDTHSAENTHKLTFSQRWRGKLGDGKFTPEELDADSRLAYLAKRYKL